MRGGILTAVLGILLSPWRLMQLSQGFIFTWLIGCSALLGPVGGIMLVDYYLVSGLSTWHWCSLLKGWERTILVHKWVSSPSYGCPCCWNPTECSWVSCYDWSCEGSSISVFCPLPQFLVCWVLSWGGLSIGFFLKCKIPRLNTEEP